ncbi:MAG: hypothetical protein ACYCYO_17855 [Bacilli bacterium]
MEKTAYTEPLVNLWQNEPTGFVLVDAKGELYRASWPGELFAILRTVIGDGYLPLVLLRAVGLQDDALWGEYLDMVRKDLCKEPASLRLWEVIETGERKGEVWDIAAHQRVLTTGKPGAHSFAVCIATVEHRDQCLREGYRYGAGPVFGKPKPIPIPDPMTNWRFF